MVNDQGNCSVNYTQVVDYWFGVDEESKPLHSTIGFQN